MTDARGMYQRMVEFLGGDTLAKRSANGLLKISVRTPEQLAMTPLDVISDIRMLGEKCVARIEQKKRLLDIARVVDVAPPGVNYAAIAEYLTEMSSRVLTVREPVARSLLNVQERTHVAGEMRRLSDWYADIARAGVSARQEPELEKEKRERAVGQRPA